MITDTSPMTTETIVPRQAPAESKESASETEVRLVGGDQLRAHLASWMDLARTAIVPNPFYEPWAILPALDYIKGNADVRFLLIFGPAAREGSLPLWGLFPLEVRTKTLHLPVRSLAFWQHKYCYLAAPLIDARHASEVLDAFWTWFENNPLKCSLLDTNYLPADGPFHALWSDFILGRTYLQLNEHPRGFQVRTDDAESCISSLLSKKRGADGGSAPNSLRLKKFRLLREQGQVTYRELNDLSEVDSWVDQFLSLESKGWKGGPNGDAIAKLPEDAAYLRSMTRAGFEQGHVFMNGFFMDGQPIAMKHALLTYQGGFAFKIAYDEKHSKYSPGFNLELEHLRRWHDDPRLQWMDPCAAPRHPMFKTICNSHRIICRSLISNNSLRGDFLASSIPLLRLASHQMRPDSLPSYLHVSTKSEPSAPLQTEVRILRANELPQYEPQWQELSKVAVSQNPFYEPWMALPAIAAAANKDSLYFVLIFGPPNVGGDKPLWGFIPLEMQSRCLHLPIRNLALWQHRYCYLTVPLIDAEHVGEVLDAFWRWFQANPLGAAILDTNHLLADGPFHAAFSDFAIGRTALPLVTYARAFLNPVNPRRSYISSTIAKKRLKEYSRQERRLSEMGKLEYRVLSSVDDADTWAEDFLRLEASGWKGEEGGRAFRKYAPDAEYFRAITPEALKRNRLHFLALCLDGKPIAMKYSIMATDGGFTVRIAYDEAFAKYSPGILLELETIRQVVSSPEVRWLDSCAAPRHPMIDRLWAERRMIRRTLFSSGARKGEVIVSLLPLIRFIKKLVRPDATVSYFQIRGR
jgi:CelD/BcsL family acetyltransferase involved in cellulose biosynthesis